jgi:serine/threonine protein kinase
VTEPHRFGAYEIQSVLGKGGMAEVYRARALEGPRTGWPVAIKRLLPALAKDPVAVGQFAREGELSKTLDHPHVVKVYEAGVVSKQPYIAMELIDGRDLGQILKRCQSRGLFLPIDFAVYLSHVLLEALAYAHGLTSAAGEPLGLVHCDISPSNLFISRTGEIKLGDFGVARARFTPQLEINAKPYYVSPEVLKGQVTPAADLWAATVTLYELLANRRPFTGTTPEEVYAAIRERAYPKLRDVRPEVPETLDHVIARGFAVDPKERFQSAIEFAQALTPLYDELIGTPLAIAAVVRGLFGAGESGSAA